MTNAREYVGPVRPPGGTRWEAWCGMADDPGHSPEWREGFNHAMRTMALWIDFQVGRQDADVVAALRRGPGLTSLGMLKSNLLGRLVRGEEIRRRPCPTHRGRLESSPMRYSAEFACCDGTGWLRNEPRQNGTARDPRGDVHRPTHPEPRRMWRDL